LKQVCEIREIQRQRRQFLWASTAPPPTKIDRSAAADTMTSALGSKCIINWGIYSTL